MKAPVSFDNFPTFAANGSRDMNPESAKYSVGFVPADTFPAEWANYMFHGATKGVSDLNTAVASIWAENANVLTQAGITPADENNGQLYSAIMKFINDAVLTANQQVLAQAKLDAHPVGSLYWSSSPTDPATLFGGTWTRIKDRFVLAAGDTYGNGATGGATSVKLTVQNLPAHNHSFSFEGTTDKVNTNHTHDFSGTTSEMSGDTEVRFNAQPNDYDNWHPYTVGRVSDTNKVSGHINAGISAGYHNGFYIDLSHTHTYSGTTGFCNGENSSVEHSHTYNGSGTTGNGKGTATAFSVLPPYIVKFCWERTA